MPKLHAVETNKPEHETGKEDDMWQELKKAGIEAKIGLSYVQDDEEFYITILKQFHEEYADKDNKLKAFFKTEDYKNYTVIVHSVKSTAKMIGALELSEQARLLEDAAKNEDGDFVRANHARMLENYARVNAAIERTVSPEETETEEEDLMVFTPEEEELFLFSPEEGEAK